MMIRFCCPACHRPLVVSDCHAGKLVACPACEKELIIPPESTREEPGPSAAPTPPEPAPHEPARPGRPRRRVAALACGLLAAVVGLAVLVPRVFRGDDADAGQVWAAAASPPDTLPNDPELGASLPGDQQFAALRPGEPDDPEEDAAPAVPSLPEPAALPAPGRANDQAPRPPERPPDPAMPPAQEAAPLVGPPAPPPKKAPAEVMRERWASKRRSRLTDEELRRQLVIPPVVDLETVPGTTKKLLYLSGKASGSGQDVVPTMVAQRADLVGLPLLTGFLARKSHEEALNLKVLSQQLRLHLQTSMPGVVDHVVDPRPDPDILRKRLLDPGPNVLWLRPQAIATLRQLLMHEHHHVRLILVEILSKIDGPQASLALAERAVFDLHPDVRLAALLALRTRPAVEYESALVAGLRYPWPAFADHAAEALVALDLREAVPRLIPLLDARDLSDPYPVEQGKSRWPVVAELVRTNHLRNCLLCHSYSSSPADPVRGLVPNVEHLVPLPSSGARPAGKWGGGGGGSSGSVVASTWVRADIVFVRQDFSVEQPVPNHGRLWPADQRYDYLVRLRPLTADALVAWQDRLRDFRPPEPQQASLLFALRELTGEDLGPSPDDWLRQYSPVTGRRLPKPLQSDELVQHLRDCLAEGSARQRAERVLLFRDKRGAAYDTALTLSLPQMTPELQKLARNVLAGRFFCLPLKELADKLAAPDAEVRRAAVTVCRQRKLRALVPELIARLDDDQADVARQAHQVLQQFAARDLGPRPGADREQRQQAMSAWREWWEQRNQKQAAAKVPSS